MRIATESLSNLKKIYLEKSLIENLLNGRLCKYCRSPLQPNANPNSYSSCQASSLTASVKERKVEKNYSYRWLSHAGSLLIL